MPCKGPPEKGRQVWLRKCTESWEGTGGAPGGTRRVVAGQGKAERTGGAVPLAMGAWGQGARSDALTVYSACFFPYHFIHFLNSRSMVCQGRKPDSHNLGQPGRCLWLPVFPP